ncbi:MAG: S1 RNA-binding domain-containing protein, partial [Holophagales bacterium]|nr:S1 RNA-binding domain-containing protein [Holophagales bacterium]
MTERSKDPDTNRDFGRVLEEFERGQELHRGKGTGRKPVVRLEPEEPKGPERQYRAPEEEEDFATALAAFEQERGSRAPGAVRPRSLEPGAEVKGTVLSIDLETAFVDLGGKAEAIVRSLDLADEDGILQYRAGDPIRARVVGPDPESGALLLSPLGPGTRAAADPRNVLAAGDVVEGTVSGTNKGGAEVDLGSRRAFCPISQLADHFVEDAAAYVGQKLRFRVERYEEGRGRSPNIVLSRRALLEEEKAARAEAVRAGLE